MPLVSPECNAASGRGTDLQFCVCPVKPPAVVRHAVDVCEGLDAHLDLARVVKDAAATAAFGLVRFYSGNETGDVPGNLPDPYYCWFPPIQDIESSSDRRRVALWCHDGHAH